MILCKHVNPKSPLTLRQGCTTLQVVQFAR
jgi:hypothetical protein